MKLVQKLTLAFLAGTTLILAGNGAFRVHREVALFESARARDHRRIGKALGAAVSAVWKSDGPERAKAVVEEANEQEGKVHVRWLESARDLPQGERDRVEHIRPGESVTLRANDPSGEETWITYVPVQLGAARTGALEISESLADERAYIRTTILDTIGTTALLAAFCAAFSSLLGFWVVGRPMRSLIAKARRIGQGDFEGPLLPAQNDELGELAREMNATCARLVEANERVGTETAARIEALEQLRHADRLMTVGKLASGIAHELGTPLNVVEARAEMIGSNETTLPEAQQYARIIVESSKRMARIIRQLLEFARRKGPQKATCDLARMARTTIELLGPLAIKKSIALTLRTAAPDATLTVDEGQVQQVLTNLIVNAIQAMDHKGEICVGISSSHAMPPAGHDRGGAAGSREYLRVDVQDQGQGIAKEHLAHVFEPFFTTKDIGEGTGLGLAVAYGIVQEHGGWIAVESEPGKGTVFSTYLPREDRP